MKIEEVNISEIKVHPDNPRVIRDEKFEALERSIKEFPQMLKLRPIVVNDEGFILGGNMRLEVCKKIGFKKVFIVNASHLTPEQQREFIIKDNVNFGQWDWDKLANEWDSEQLKDWGMDVWHQEDVDLDSFFEEKEEEESGDESKKNKITLEYTDEDYSKVQEAFNEISGSKEQIVFELLMKKLNEK